MQKSTALNPMAGYLKDGQLTVGVHLSLPVTHAVNSGSLAFLPYVFCMCHFPKPLQLQVDPPVAKAGDALHSALCTNIAALFDDPVSSDVEIKAGDTTVHAHKLILIASSPAFKAMFQVSSISAVVGQYLLK